jgi:putative tryptophan/tyrosine transport system substrate-binding protein
MRFDQLKRREFVTLLGSAAVAWPLAARAQQSAMPVIGFLNFGSPETNAHLVAAFRKGFGEIGYIEGHTATIEFRWAQNERDRLAELAADLVRRQVAVIVATGGEPTPQVAKAATQVIPIVFTANGDPVRDGLVASLNRPSGNVTGITIFGGAAVSKRLQLMRELMPKAAAIAYLVNPNSPNGEIEMRAAQTAAHTLGQQILVLNASNDREIDTAFAAMVQQRAGALLVASDALFFSRRNQLVSLAARQGIPAIYYLREFALAGGLMTYGSDLTDAYRLVGIYVGRILKGEKPADLPVQQSTKFELVINLQTARALGIEVPNSMQLLADEVIE